ncbi:MAG: OmpA family protein [Flavobacteriaceae bacterium]|nr:OmpA family protein [Flavobacteriaceae bacterium]
MKKAIILTLMIGNSLFSQITNTGEYTIKNLSLNTVNSDFGATFYKNEYIIYSSLQKVEKKSYFGLNIATIEGSEIIKTKPFKANSENKHHETNLVYTKDGKTVYFTSNNSIAERKNTYKKIKTLYIYRANVTKEGKHINVKSLPFCDPKYSVAHPALNEDNTKMYFSSNMPGGFGDNDIYVVDMNKDGSFGEPVNLGENINTSSKEAFPFIRHDDILYYASNKGDEKRPNLDIYMSSKLENGLFEKGTMLKEPINTQYDDFGYIINKKNEGYFSSNRSGGVGKDDIYYFKETKRYIRKCNVDIVINVVDSLSNKDFLVADVTLSTEDKTNVLIINQGIYKYNTQENCYNYDYKISVSKQGYHPYSNILNIEKGSEKIEVNVKILKIRVIPRVVNIFCKLPYFENIETLDRGLSEKNYTLKITIPKQIKIYYKFGSHVIADESVNKMSQLIEFVKINSNYNIKIESYTDYKGSKEYNEKLSYERANTINKAIISKGVKKDRLTIINHGEIPKDARCETDKVYDYNHRKMSRKVVLSIVKI